MDWKLVHIAVFLWSCVCLFSIYISYRKIEKLESLFAYVFLFMGLMIFPGIILGYFEDKAKTKYIVIHRIDNSKYIECIDNQKYIVSNDGATYTYINNSNCINRIYNANEIKLPENESKEFIIYKK